MLNDYIKKYRKRNFGVLALSFLLAMVQVFAAVIHTFSTDQLIQGNVKMFFVWNLASLFLWGGIFLIDYYKSIFEEKITQNIASDIRVDITKRLSVTSYANFMSKNEGTYVSWLNNDLQQIEEKGIKQYYIFWDCLFQVSLSAIALITYHYSLIFLILILIGLLMKFPVLFEKRMNIATTKLAKANETFLSKLQDTISGYSVFFGYGKTSQMFPLVRRASKDLGTQKVEFTKTNKKAEGFIGSVNILSQVAVVTYTGILAGLNIVTIGALSTTGSLASSVFNAISMGSSSQLLMKSVDAYFEKYQEFEEEMEEQSQPLKLKSTLEIKNLNYKIAEKPILENLNLIFEKGKKYAVIGDSGSGKSTLLNILSGRIENYTGEIILDDKALDPSEYKELRSMTSYTPQEGHIFMDTVLANVTLWDNTVGNLAKKSLKRLGIDTFISPDEELFSNGRSLSGGQKQRIAVARALTKPNNMVLLDESTANLDKRTALSIENTFLDNPEATVVIVTHHLFKENKQKFDKVIRLS